MKEEQKCKKVDFWGVCRLRKFTCFEQFFFSTFVRLFFPPFPTQNLTRLFAHIAGMKTYKIHLPFQSQL